jgi:hypothetical protein
MKKVKELMSTKMGGINKDERALPKHMYKKKKQKGGSVANGMGGYSGGISSGSGSGTGAGGM